MAQSFREAHHQLGYHREPPPLSGSFYENQHQLVDSYTTGSSEESATTRSTVKTVNFRNPPATVSAPQIGSSQMAQTVELEQVVTDNVLVRQPRSLLMLACIQFAVATQILVFAMICRFYEGCPYATGIWTSSVFILNAILGIVFLKLRPRRPFLYAYFASTILSLLLTVVLFAITAWLLHTEDRLLRQKGWDFIKEHLFRINRIIENTKIAMYSLHLVLVPIHGICCGASAVLLFQNIREVLEGKTKEGFYVSNAPVGHQTVLIPIELKPVREIPPGGRTLEDQPDASHYNHRTLVSVGVQTIPGAY